MSGLPPKGFSTAFQPLFRAWAQAGSKTLAQAAPVPAFAQSSNDLAVLMGYQAALVNDYAGFHEEAAAQYAMLQQHADMLPNRVAQGLINYLEQQGKTKDAQAALDAHRRTHPESVLALDAATPKPTVANPAEGAAEVLYGMASIFAGMQAQAEARAHLHLALMLRPDFGTAHFMMAMLLEQTHQFQAARAEYAAVPVQDALYRQAQLRLALVSHALEQPKEAFTILDHLQKTDAKDYTALVAKGDLLRDAKDYMGAASAYSQALARLPTLRADHWRLFYARGIAYERARQWPKAEADFTKALELQPRQPEVQNYLAYSWLVQGMNLDRAQKLIADALSQQPENPAILDSMGWVLFLQNKPKDALGFAEQALDMMPKDPIINDHLGDIYWRLGREGEAQYQWERALYFKPTEPGQKEALERKLRHGLPAAKSDAPPRQKAL